MRLPNTSKLLRSRNPHASWSIPDPWANLPHTLTHLLHNVAHRVYRWRSISLPLNGDISTTPFECTPRKNTSPSLCTGTRSWTMCCFLSWLIWGMHSWQRRRRRRWCSSAKCQLHLSSKLTRSRITQVWKYACMYACMYVFFTCVWWPIGLFIDSYRFYVFTNGTCILI